MKKTSSIVLTTLILSAIIILGGTAPVLAQTATQLLSSSVLQNNTTQNALSVIQNQTVGKGRADGGAVLINNTGNQHTGLTIYSNLGALVAQPLMRLEIDNEGWDEEVLYIKSDSPTSRGLIRLDSPAPEIEFVETDQTGAKGKFEIRVQHDNFQINSRRDDDTTFENKINVTHAGDLELVTGVLKVAGSKASEFKGGINITGGCLAINGKCVTAGSLETSTTEETNTTSSNTSGAAGKAAVSRGAPAAVACNSYQEQGTFVLDAENHRLYICNGPERGWDYTSLTN